MDFPFLTCFCFVTIRYNTAADEMRAAYKAGFKDDVAMIIEVKI